MSRFLVRSVGAAALLGAAALGVRYLGAAASLAPPAAAQAPAASASSDLHLVGGPPTLSIEADAPMRTAGADLPQDAPAASLAAAQTAPPEPAPQQAAPEQATLGEPATVHLARAQTEPRPAPFAPSAPPPAPAKATLASLAPPAWLMRDAAGQAQVIPAVWRAPDMAGLATSSRERLEAAARRMGMVAAPAHPSHLFLYVRSGVSTLSLNLGRNLDSVRRGDWWVENSVKVGDDQIGLAWRKGQFGVALVGIQRKAQYYGVALKDRLVGLRFSLSTRN